LEARDLFVAFAEVSVAFAGFASIVTALQRQSQAKWADADRFRFRAGLRTSLIATAFSLLPLTLDLFGLNGVAIWQTSSGLLALYMIRSALTLRDPMARSVVWGPVMTLLAAAWFVSIAIQFANLHPAISGAPLFVAGLCHLLFAAGHNFYSLVASGGQSER
jgi:hypothetical protein